MTAHAIERSPRLRERPKVAGAVSFPYQLDVVASDVTDIVRSAGGWLFDRARGGWEVTAFVPEGCDPRPLHILGVKTLSLTDWIGCDDRRPHALAVAANVVAGNSVARKTVFAALESGVAVTPLVLVPVLRYRVEPEPSLSQD
jgi:hypothetical protein